MSRIKRWMFVVGVAAIWLIPAADAFAQYGMR